MEIPIGILINGTGITIGQHGPLHALAQQMAMRSDPVMVAATGTVYSEWKKPRT